MQTDFQSNQDLEILLSVAGRLVVEGADLSRFTERIRVIAPALAPDVFDSIRGGEQDKQRAAGMMAYAIWAACPNPNDGWRKGKVSMPGRNDPCICGSGIKFKQCCNGIQPPVSLFQNMNVLRYVLDAYPNKALPSLDLSRVDLAALADAAHQWLEQGELKRVELLLEPLFADPLKCHADHQEAFDVLMSAWLDLDRPRKRQKLVEALLQNTDTELNSTVRQRKITMFADADQWDEAWALFNESLRRLPDSPAFAILEITLLIQQGRNSHAKARAEFWRQRLRRLGPQFNELADDLVLLAKSPRDAILQRIDPQNLDFTVLSALLSTAPRVSVNTIAMNRVETIDGFTEITPISSLADIQGRWSREFEPGKPLITMMQSDSPALLDRMSDILVFFQQAPNAWFSFSIIDDIVLALSELATQASMSPTWYAILIRFTDFPMAQLERLLPSTLQRPAYLAENPVFTRNPEAGLSWMSLENRPILRLLSQRVLALEAIDPQDPDINPLLHWLLHLNSNDNHGFRYKLSERYLLEGKTQSAMQIFDAYPDDVAPSFILNRVLALFQLNQADQAQVFLNANIEDTTESVKAIVRDKYPKPRDFDQNLGVIGGRRSDAWAYRQDMRSLWQECGALEWLRSASKA